MNSLVSDSSSAGEIQLLSALTNPFVNLIVQLDFSVLDCWSTPGCISPDDATLVRRYCNSAVLRVEVIEEVRNVNGDVVMQNIATQQVPFQHGCK